MSKHPVAVFAAILLLITPAALIPQKRAAIRQTFRMINHSPQAAGWTAGTVEKLKPGLAPAILGKIRTGRHESFDRVVFEFRGSTVPGYHVEYIDRPVRACGSGDVVKVAGDGWLSVRLTPAQAHTDAGKPTIGYRERRLRLPVLRELQSTCDFEGEVEWVLGVSSPNRYRVMELSNPARLVIDLKH